MQLGYFVDSSKTDGQTELSLLPPPIPLWPLSLPEKSNFYSPCKHPGPTAVPGPITSPAWHLSLTTRILRFLTHISPLTLSRLQREYKNDLSICDGYLLSIPPLCLVSCSLFSSITEQTHSFCSLHTSWRTIRVDEYRHQARRTFSHRGNLTIGSLDFTSHFLQPSPPTCCTPTLPLTSLWPCHPLMGRTRISR